MKKCCVCHKKQMSGNGSFFTVPKDDRRAKWSKICNMDFSRDALICADHFAASSYIKTGRNVLLLPSAVPIKTLVMPPQLQEDPVVDIQQESVPEKPVSKSLSRAGSKQSKTRLCGLVETIELSDEFRLNCFYCPEVFPLEKWKFFVKHLREKHFEKEERFKTCDHVSEDSTSTNLNLSSPADTALKAAVTNSKADLPLAVDPLESINLSFCIKTLNETEDELEANDDCEPESIQTLNETEEEEELEAKEEYEPDSIEIVQQKSTEIAFEYTPRDIVDSLLDSMKNYPVLWQFDDKPFNDDFYEAVEDLCKIINDKWSLNIDNLKMRRSINRLLRFYCYLYPNDNIENIDQFTCYYDKCAAFLPSVNEIAYARCSHCYICYTNDSDLKRHLLEEYQYLQWPHKCVQCKECFLHSDEYEFHKCLPHYDENFRCEPCNKTFFRRNMYNKHVLEKHTEEEEGEYKCDVCEKVFKHRNYLRNHKQRHGEKTHKCHLCPKSYINISLLKIHLKRHRRQYDFMCELCGHKLFSASSLKVHMKKHTKEKVTCSICNLKLRKSSLSRHVKIVHVAYEGTIEQTSKGRHLNYTRFDKSSPFRKRKRRSHVCKICNMNFENYKLALEHDKEYHPDISKCKICNNDYGLKKNLKRHYRRRHKLEPLQVYKLVDEDEDLNVVLAYDQAQLEELEKTLGSKTKRRRVNVGKSIIKPIKSDFSADEDYFEEEKYDCSNIQDEIMNADDDSETKEDFLIEFLEEES